MQDKTVFTATEARQNFFELLRMAEEGKEPVVIKKDSKIRFKIIKTQQKAKNKMKIAEEMGRIGFPVLSVKKIKKILSTMHDIKL